VATLIGNQAEPEGTKPEPRKGPSVMNVEHPVLDLGDGHIIEPGEATWDRTQRSVRNRFQAKDHSPDIRKIEADVAAFLGSELVDIAKGTKDSNWTNVIHKRLAEIGHNHGFLVFASKNRCPTANCPEWLYDHHWRVPGNGSTLVRIPLVMEIERGWGAATIFDKITEDFLKLVQARADLRVMVFQCNGVVSITDKLIAMAEDFDGTQQGDRWLFAGWGWDTNQMHCRLWSA
jgi:hypothetical protein